MPLCCRATDTPFCSPIPYSVDDPNELADLEEDANLTIEELRAKYASRGKEDEESFEDEEGDESYEQEEDSEDDEIDEADDIPEGTHFSLAIVISSHFLPSTNCHQRRQRKGRLDLQCAPRSEPLLTPFAFSLLFCTSDNPKKRRPTKKAAEDDGAPKKKKAKVAEEDDE